MFYNCPYTTKRRRVPIIIATIPLSALMSTNSCNTSCIPFLIYGDKVVQTNKDHGVWAESVDELNGQRAKRSEKTRRQKW